MGPRLKPAPFFFRRLGASEAYVVSNQLASWAILSDQAELHKLIATPDECHDIENLIAAGLVIEESETARKTYALAAESYLTKKFQAALFRPSLVMVVPTLRCDHKCAYCQVSRAPLSSSKHDQVLDPRAVATFIDSVAEKSFKLEFQGGEPLLAQRWIIELTKELRLLRGQGFEIVICSALGPMMEEEFLAWALEQKVNFSVSFDGFSDLHKKNRPHVRLVDSATNTLVKAEVLRSRGLQVSFVATLTREAVNRGAQNYVDGCLRANISRIYSRPIAEYGFAATTKNTLGVDSSTYLTFLSDLLDEQIARFGANTAFVDDSILLWLAKAYRTNLVRHVDTMSPAGYALSTCLINYDGHVFGSDEARMLYESTKNEHLPIGTLDNDGFVRSKTSFHEEVLANSFVETKPHCETCAYQPFCGLDPIGVLREQADLIGSVPHLSQCEITLGALDAIFERVRRGTLTTEMVQTWLSM